MWPTAATTPLSTIRSIAARAPSRSGARVTMRIAPAPASRTRPISAGSGSRIRDDWWAPHRLVESQGPSRWIPASKPRAHVVGQSRYLAQQFGRGGGNQGRDECGGAVPAVQCQRQWTCRRSKRWRSSPPPRRAHGCRRSRAPPSPHRGPDPRAGAQLRRRPHTRCRSKPQSNRAATVLGPSAGCRRSTALRCPANPAWSGRSRGSSRRAEAGRAAASSSSAVTCG